MANVLHPNLALIYGAEEWKGTPLLIFVPSKEARCSIRAADRSRSRK